MSDPTSTSRPSGSTTLFDRWSATYDRDIVQRFTYRPLHDAVLRSLGPIRPARVVDIGCGTGQLTRRLAGHFSGARVIGFDYSAGMLARAQTRLEALETTALGRADATNLPCAPGSVDLITCTESFHWYPDQEKSLRDMHTALRSGGRVVIGSIAAFSALEQRALEHLSSRIDQPIRALTASSTAELMEAVGLNVVAQRRVPRPSILLPLPLLTIGYKPE